jgi:broad specificity phosphatase PhoE
VPRFILVRHGETVDNKSKTIQGWQGSQLTELGHEQAKAVVKVIPAQPDMIFSSDLHRCLQTAEHIREHFKDVPLLHDWRLRERSFGPQEGTSTELMDWTNYWATPPTESFKGAEPHAFFAERLKSFVRDTHVFGADTFLIVTHGGVLNRFGYLFQDGFEHTAYPNTAVVEYDIEYDNPRLTMEHEVIWRPSL